jgi:hypothetical protein
MTDKTKSARTWPHPQIDPNHPKLEPGQTELTPEQKDFARARLTTLATLQRLAKKFNPDANPHLLQAPVATSDQNL